MIFPGIFLFGLDKLLRVIQSRPQTCILSARVFPCKAIELILPKDPKMNYTPASVIFVKIPTISKYQWHSFSITSSSIVDKHTMSIVIRSEGWWTSSLYNLLVAMPDEEADQRKCISVAVEGPYGPASVDFQRYDTVLLVAGGIGITPFLSILQEISSARSNGGHKLPSRIELIYAVKKSLDISLLNPVLPQLLDTEQCYLKLKVFVTQESQSGSKTLTEILDEVSQIQTINFMTASSSYATYGVENLYWMAAIVGISSVVFLACLSFFNRFILHPSVKPSTQKIPSSVTDIFLLCSLAVAIICSSLVAVIVRWRRLRKELPSFSSLTNKATIPGSLETDDKVLEENEIHFGGRPNFKEIFAKFSNDIRGSTIGVFVCGPESMKESVASTCRLNSHVLCGDDKSKKPFLSFHSLNFTL